MHIFLVNDDGIGSKGIMALARAATGRGHKVTMCAPATQQSAASQRITLAEPIYVAPYPSQDPLLTAYAITGTPTDCVRLGLQNLAKEPVDVLISGINDGYNSGMAVHYSGTVAAAREGALNGLHAIAAHHHKASQALIDKPRPCDPHRRKLRVLSLPRGSSSTSTPGRVRRPLEGGANPLCGQLHRRLCPAGEPPGSLLAGPGRVHRPPCQAGTAFMAQGRQHDLHGQSSDTGRPLGISVTACRPGQPL